MVVFNPFLPSYQANPYPAYAALRAEDPVHFSAAIQAWVLTAYEDCERVLRDQDTFSSSSYTASGQLATVLQQQRREFPLGEGADGAQLRPAGAHPPPRPAQPRLHPSRHRGPAPPHRGDRRLAARGRGPRPGRPLRRRHRLRAATPDHRNRGAPRRPPRATATASRSGRRPSRTRRTCSTPRTCSPTHARRPSSSSPTWTRSWQSAAPRRAPTS